MLESKDKYIKSVKKACNEMRLDYFPQVEASELLYKVITLEDIYLPLSLGASSYDLPSYGSDLSNFDIDELIHRIDEKIAALEAEEARKSNPPTINNSDDDVKSLATPNVGSAETIGATVGLRLLIEANPGSGKTTFCKRLALAILNNDASFFEKYAKENGLYFSKESMPILISCKNLADLSAEELRTNDFTHLMYRLCVQSFGSHFSDISEPEFVELINSCNSKNITIILDGWDEILDPEKEAIFCENFNKYIELHPEVDTVLTIRVSYVAPELAQPYSERYVIRALSDEDIREFCKKWCEIILNPNQQRAKNYSLISEQILSSKDHQIRTMMKNPLDLSLLLTVSKNDGRLPENKAELFKELVDLYIFWSTNKSTGTLTAKSIRVFLAYIASNFTKNNRLHCDENELLLVISQAIHDLEWTFSEDISLFDLNNIAKELSHTGILTRTYDGKRFSFSESNKGTHRQMQEYLTAYAILAQYSDEEYNSMSPIEIFEDKYRISKWREVIIFITLMNNGRLRQDIIKRLILKAEENIDNNYAYTNLLFDLIVSGADIRLADKHNIYDIIFSKHITDQQIANINLLISSASRSSSDFITYISSMFSKSVECGESEYGYAKAVIEASIALQQGLSPFEHAEMLMRSDKDVDIVTGSEILIIIAWCKYANVNNFFTPFSLHYKMSIEWINVYNKLLEERRCTTHLLKSIREAVLADFAKFDDFFDANSISEASLQIDDTEKKVDCELLLSIAPIFDPSFSCPTSIDKTTKDKYLQKLKDEIENKAFDEIIFSFSVCASIGCWSANELEKEWNTIDGIYKKLKNDGYIGKARYLHLKAGLRQKAGFFEPLDGISEFSTVPDFGFPSPLPFWSIKERQSSYFIYSNGQKEIKISFPKIGLSQDAKGFLDNVLSVSLTTNNNLAYLLRRHELESLTTNSNPPTEILPKQLLENGIRVFDVFSVINYALSISDIYINNTGEFAVGKDYLFSIKDFLHSSSIYWDSVVAWWRNLAIQRNEYEGLVVLTWLFDLGLLNLDSFERPLLNYLYSGLLSLNSNIEDFTLFSKAIHNALVQL